MPEAKEAWHAIVLKYILKKNMCLKMAERIEEYV
jgi:hypothetical protein